MPSIQSFLLGLIIAAATTEAANVVHLTEETFSKVVDGSNNVLVEFYAPWCGHCKNLEPEWRSAAELFEPSDGIILAALDATTAQSIAGKYEVKGYPTIKFFPKGSTTAEDPDTLGRSAETIVRWVNEKIGTKKKIKKAPSSVTELSTDNFDKIALDPTKTVLVEFYAPWCGHCKQLAPKYESLAKAFAGESDVVIANVDATESPDLANRYDVQGYPTLKLFSKGDKNVKLPETYEGGRELDDLVGYVNGKAGTFRKSDGSLTENAGRIKLLDELVANANGKFDSSLLDLLKAKVDELTTEEAKNGKSYVGIVEKVITKGEDYVSKEITRLDGMISSPSVSPLKKTNFMTRRNILSAFVVA